VSDRHMDGLFDILGFMTNDPHITTVGLAIVADVCKREILRQHPQLTGLRYAGSKHADAVNEWVNLQAEFYGRQLPVSPLPAGFKREHDLDYVFRVRKEAGR
jgi:hypothetical protein